MTHLAVFRNQDFSRDLLVVLSFSSFASLPSFLAFFFFLNARNSNPAAAIHAVHPTSFLFSFIHFHAFSLRDVLLSVVVLLEKSTTSWSVTDDHAACTPSNAAFCLSGDVAAFVSICCC
jgi:hypothetical protein